MTYDALVELCRLHGSAREWPELAPLDVDGLAADLLEIAKLKAERHRNHLEDDDAD